jgi:hypothetical protein
MVLDFVSPNFAQNLLKSPSQSKERMEREEWRGTFPRPRTGSNLFRKLDMLAAAKEKTMPHHRR